MPLRQNNSDELFQAGLRGLRNRCPNTFRGVSCVVISERRVDVISPKVNVIFPKKTLSPQE